MDHIVKIEQASATSYAARRAAMADETRIRILDACVAILARGVAELSIPAVARQAGVSVPTVYRNFPDKKTLVAETAEHLRKKRARFAAPNDLSELAGSIRAQFEHSASLDETVRAALASEPIMAARRDAGEQARRTEAIERLIGDQLRPLSPRDREHALRLITTLCSSSALHAFRTIVGATPAQAADTVAWTIARVLGTELPTPPARKAKGTKR